MTAGVTVIAGLPIPSTSPVFLAVVGVHVAAGLVSVVAGAAAMLSRKGRGRHASLGRIYFWALVVGFVAASGLAAVRWSQDYPLFLLGASAMAAALLARMAIRRGGPVGVRTHLVAMGWSYITLLTAFYVDNGKSLPLWRLLPPIAFWLLPSVIGLPVIGYMLARHPLIGNAQGLRRGHGNMDLRP